jgi:diguanylate cyclase (GGDEF)-like protein
MEAVLNILLIDDSQEGVVLFQKMLEQSPKMYQLTHALSLEKALTLINGNSYSLIFIDLFLPDMQGIDTLLTLQQKVDSVPIIVIGRDEKIAREAIHVGAQDYLPKEEINLGLLERVIEYAIERQQHRENLKALSFTDELTSLYNRRGFMTLLEQQISLSKRIRRGFYLFVIDLDHLKQINDTFGHPMGDKALISAAQCLKASFRRHDVLGRIGGDEFAAVAIYSISDSGEYLKRRLFENIEAYNTHSKEPFQLSFSVGGIYFDGLHEATLDELFKEADNELYKEKKLTH